MSISLASLRSERACAAPRIGIYGRPGVGKTTLAATAPSPVFILTEDGLGEIQPVPKHTPLCRVYTDVLQWINQLRVEEHAYHTVVLDSLDGLEPLLIDHIARQDGKTKEDFALGRGNFGYGKGHLRLADEMGVFLEALDSLREARNMAIILLGHDQVKRFEAPDSEGYDRYQLAIHEKMAQRVTAWLDVVAWAHKRTSITRGQDGRARATGIGERILTVEDSSPTQVAKKRYATPVDIDMNYAAKVGIVVALTTPAAVVTP